MSLRARARPDAGGSPRGRARPVTPVMRFVAGFGRSAFRLARVGVANAATTMTTRGGILPPNSRLTKLRFQILDPPQTDRALVRVGVRSELRVTRGTATSGRRLRVLEVLGVVRAHDVRERLGLRGRLDRERSRRPRLPRSRDRGPGRGYDGGGDARERAEHGQDRERAEDAPHGDRAPGEPRRAAAVSVVSRDGGCGAVLGDFGPGVFGDARGLAGRGGPRSGPAEKRFRLALDPSPGRRDRHGHGLARSCATALWKDSKCVVVLKNPNCDMPRAIEHAGTFSGL